MRRKGLKMVPSVPLMRLQVEPGRHVASVAFPATAKTLPTVLASAWPRLIRTRPLDVPFSCGKGMREDMRINDI